MINVIIIDDEPAARTLLKILLEEYKHEIRIVGEASSAREGIELIQKETVHLIFLDVEMPQMDGFAMLRQFETIDFDVIFTTSYSEYAIDAIKLSALDYLLKPIDIDELEASIERFKGKQETQQPVKESIYFLPKDFTNLQNQHSKIALPIAKGFQILFISELFYCEADRNYTLFYLKDGKKITVSRNLKYFGEKLEPFGFFRIHESFLINLSHLKSYLKGRGGQVVLSNEVILDVARSRKKTLLKLLSL